MAGERSAVVRAPQNAVAAADPTDVDAGAKLELAPGRGRGLAGHRHGQREHGRHEQFLHDRPSLSLCSSTQAATHRERLVAWPVNIPHRQWGGQAKLFRRGKMFRFASLFRSETATTGGNV